jgi:hypothetical protein
MGYPGENAGGRRTSRRPATPARATAPGHASLFAPGYSGARASGRENAPAGAGRYGPAGGASGKGPVRGFPPAPGQPPPLYPPGQFAAWNREPARTGNGHGPDLGGGWQPDDPGSVRAPGYSDAGYADTGHPEYGDAGWASGYAALAVSDPAADVTSTQSWGAVGDAAASAGPHQATGPHRAATGPFDLATPAPFDRPAPAPADRGASVPGRSGRGSRGRKRRRAAGRRVRTLLICGLALVVVAGALYFWLIRGRRPAAPAADAQRTPPSARPVKDPSPSSSPLGGWGHIETRALDPVPLTLAELFPASFSDGSVSYVETVQKAKVHCAGALVGSQLVAAVGRAGCTQAMRASYLASSGTLMGTIGVLNLATATAAEQAGKAAGPAEYIAQLPASSGPTRNLTKGTGFEAAEVKGHYLVLVWAEFVDLRAPTSSAQRTELEDFISLLMQKTANISLATRQVTGSPPAG